MGGEADKSTLALARGDNPPPPIIIILLNKVLKCHFHKLVHCVSINLTLKCL
jgi:hypothetical protein